MILADIIQSLTTKITPISQTARLDAELLVAFACQYSRTFLYTHPQHPLTVQQEQQIHLLSTRYMQGEPMAYILGQQEFWSLNFKVTPATLIPRPETEHLVEWILQHFPANSTIRLADLGTGCGAIAIAIASERANWQIDATDQNSATLDIARINAQQLSQPINFFLGNWCQALPHHHYDVLVSNPPYICTNDPHLPNLRYEPAAALIAGTEGLDAIITIAQEAQQYLVPGGYLVLEHGYDQAEKIHAILQQLNFQHIESHTDLAGLARYMTSSK